ncbi:DUF1223 domain-containing protein [Winogradskyella sp. PE311]|uniref:DUF1223 domain-containing protein n=1 Tax=Winogradskyella sp. PE311 TaxID=3366943 RepID=UPI0039804BA8
MKSTMLTLFIMPLLFTTSLNEEYTKYENTVVLELFTSQGCSSCPPADKILNEVKEENVIALSYHVDYWNYIGWNDPFSKVSYSNKQRRYATKFGSSSIYTPQLVINGKEHIVGSKRALVRDKIKEYSKDKSQSKISISNLLKSESLINFDYKYTGELKDKIIRAILIINKRTTTVKRGENKDRILVNSNIVVNEQQFDLIKNYGKGSISIPNLVNAVDNLSLVLIIEDKALNIESATLKAI